MYMFTRFYKIRKLNTNVQVEICVTNQQGFYFLPTDIRFLIVSFFKESYMYVIFLKYLLFDKDFPKSLVSLNGMYKEEQFRSCQNG